MSPEVAVVARLEALSPVVALVDDRIYQLILPQKPVLRAIRVQLISDPRPQHLRGPAFTVISRVQVDSYAASVPGQDPWAAVAEVAAAVRGDGCGSGLWGWTGAIGSPQFRVHNAQLVLNGNPFYEAGELRAWRIQQDYMIHWTA